MAKQRYTKGVGDSFMVLKGDPIKAKIDGHHKKLMKQVNSDVNDMIEYRRPSVRMAEEAIMGYMALSPDVKPGRSKFFPPVLHAIIYSSLALKASSMPNVKYKHRLSKSEPLMKFLNAAKENAEHGDGDLRPPSLFCWFQQNFDVELFGVGFRHLSYLLLKKKIHVKNDRGRWVEKNAILHDDIWDEHLNYFHTGVSRDMLPGMYGGTSTYNDKFYRRESFSTMFRGNENYFNVELALEKFKGDPFIRVRRFWTREDLFFVQAMSSDDDMTEEGEEGIPMREDYLLEKGPSERPQIMLPVTSMHGEFNFDMRASEVPNFTQDARQYTDLLGPSRRLTFWSKGKGQIAKGCIGIKRSIHRATHDNMKASTVFFAMSMNPGVLNQIKRADLYGILPLKADDRSFNVKALLERNQAFEGIAEYDEAIDNIAAGALGTDWRQTAAMLTNEKATVAAIRENLKNVRAKFDQNFNDSGPVHRHYRLLMNLIQQFYPEKTQIDLLPGEEIPKETDEKDIIRDEDGQPIGYMREKMIPFKEPIVVKLKNGRLDVRADDVEGDSLVPMKKEFIVTQEEPEIYIEPGSTFAELKSLERAMDLERLQHYAPYLGMIYPNESGQPEPLIPRAGAEHLLKKSAEVWDDDPDELLGRIAEEERREPKFQRPYSGKPKEEMATAPPGLPVQMPGGQATPGKTLNGVGGQTNQLAQSLVPGA